MKLSARNILKGTIKQITPGAVDTEVTIELSPGVEIVSIITKKPISPSDIEIDRNPRARSAKLRVIERTG